MTESPQTSPAGAEKLFEIKMSGKLVMLRIHPPEAGKRASLTDIQKELRRRNVPYRHETLFDIYRRASNDFEPLASQEITRFDVMVDVSEDHQRASMTVVAPDVGEDTLTPARVKKALEDANVHKGIRYDVVKDLLLEQKAVEGVLIAQGQAREDGVDGRIEIQAEPEEHATVEENTADYRERDLISNVDEGDLIALITFPTAGQDGFDVHGRVLRARPGKRARFKVGRNVRLSEEGSELFAVRSGYVVRQGDRISVENILEVTNVNAETGNIRFHGVVRVQGQVEDTFLVEAEKGIEVAGTVGKATLRCKGDIRIKGGAFGAKLDCDGTLYARFLSECTARAGGHAIVDEYILHSEVVAKNAVRVTRVPKGFITGGRVRAGTEIIASNLGSDVSEVRTQLEVGSGVNVRKRFDALQQRIDVNLDTFDKVRKNLLYLQHQRESEGDLDAQKRDTYERMVGAAHKLIDDLHRQAQTHHELLANLADPEELVGTVLVSQAANAGTSIQIQTSKVNLRDALEGCGFTLLNGALKGLPYGQALKIYKQQRAQLARRQAP